MPASGKTVAPPASGVLRYRRARPGAGRRASGSPACRAAPDRSSRSAACTRRPGGSAGSAGLRRFPAASRAARRCAPRARAQTGNSPRSKNMPSLVRASLTSLRAGLGVRPSPSAPARVRASAISSSHSSSESRSPKTTTRGLAHRHQHLRPRGRRRAARPLGVDAPAGHRHGHRRRGGERSGGAAWSRRAWWRSAIAGDRLRPSRWPSSTQHDRRAGGRPRACATIQSRSSGVIDCCGHGACMLLGGRSPANSQRSRAAALRRVSGSRGCG